MLFNSFDFIFIFFPVCFAGFALLLSANLYKLIMPWLLVCSLFFYADWNPGFLKIIVFSILVNYTLARFLFRIKKMPVLVLGVAFNLVLLGWFKYTHFFLENINTLLGAGLELEAIILPLAISFFTFQQIAYLVDVYKQGVIEKNLVHYALFVCFFPQLIAGPIVHHRQVLPQYRQLESGVSFKWAENITIGLFLFSLGLFKKVVLADNFVIYVDAAFDSGEQLTSAAAWLGAICYYFQIYFDFSAYSDMALGLARCFGIVLPLNFFSPYRSRNIILFWRTWHMTLSRFLKDHLYIPLGGNRQGQARRLINLMITMLLGGLWHGANWTFVAWGGLHGIYLVINHLWGKLAVARFIGALPGASFFSFLLTQLAVIVAWVYFRSNDLASANNMLRLMFGLQHNDSGSGLFTDNVILYGLLIFSTLIIFMPNVYQLLSDKNYLGGTEKIISIKCLPVPVFKPGVMTGMLLAVLVFIALGQMGEVKEFIYFNF